MSGLPGWVCLDSPSAVGWGVPPPGGVYLSGSLASAPVSPRVCLFVVSHPLRRRLASSRLSCHRWLPCSLPGSLFASSPRICVCPQRGAVRLPASVSPVQSTHQACASCPGVFSLEKEYNSAFSFRASLLAWSDGMLLGVGGLHCSRFVCFASLLARRWSTVSTTQRSDMLQRSSAPMLSCRLLAVELLHAQALDGPGRLVLM